MKRDHNCEDYLQDIVDAAAKARSFVAGIDFKQFAEDDKTSFAVIRALEIIGEASKQVPEAVRAGSPDVPWREMAGMRDKVIHAYFGVSLELVWETVQRELVPMATAVAAVLRQVRDDAE